MPYRDEKEALRARITELDRTLSAIDEKSRELAAMKDGEKATREERDDLRRKLRELDGPRKLPMLDNLSVASPCGEAWDAMVGDDTARYCLKCEKNVYDLSSMTKAEAETLIQAKEGKLCVRFYRRADGTVLTADCPEGVARKRRKSFAAGVLGASLLAGGGFLASKLLGSAPEVVQGGIGPATMGDIGPPPKEEHVMGKIASPPPSATTSATAHEQGEPTFDPRAGTRGQGETVEQVLPFTPPKPKK